MERLLVCLDSSPRSAKVLSTAVDLAKRTGAKLRLLRVVGLPPEIPTDALMLQNISLTQMLTDTAKKELADLAKTVPADLLEGTETIVGSPWDGICRDAKERNADVIVVGSHGYGALDRLLGTTAAKVVNHADRSVLVVR